MSSETRLGCRYGNAIIYEHIIRDEGDLSRIRRYITENPFKWAVGHDNPAM
jgi:hypothetical protein